jgi:hypothetical protein
MVELGVVALAFPDMHHGRATKYPQLRKVSRGTSGLVYRGLATALLGWASIPEIAGVFNSKAP